jgi:hypothetical protein
MKKFLMAVAAAGLLSIASGGTVWGGLLFIGANSDDPEHFAFVVTTNYSAGTVLNFTDSSYGNNVAGESDKFRWTEHFNVTPTPGPLSLTLPSALTVGQVVIYDDTDNRFERPDGSAFGSVSGAESDFSTGGENIFAYQGTVTQDMSAATYRGNTSAVTSFDGGFLWGLSRGSWQTSGAGITSDSYLPASTEEDFAFNTALDNVFYNGPRSFNSVAEMIAAIKDSGNWTGSDSVPATTANFGGDFTAVPEPTALLKVGMAVIGCVVRRRRIG